MRLSVILVNYNVRYFLEQALLSVRKAMQGISGEVWVVDNRSADGSAQMVRDKFPEVRLIANAENVGFAKANNQAIRESAGDYVLLLNPDTVVEEDTFHKCLAFMDAHPDAGALGVRLIDGSGTYLPESKRGFPTPWVAFCKTFGLSALFPRSRVFNRYYLGHIDPDQTAQVDVLAGCFMWIRREALEKAGLLDEAFFMYGEDIDLSYRITQAGYRNYYYPEARIIHYKGESTKRGSLNYVRTFYQAMIIFARKHFSGGQADLFVLMLQGAIWFRAALTLLANFWKKMRLPLADAATVYAGLVLLKNFWANYYYHDPDWFKPSVLWFNFPLYILIWLGSVWLNGGYDEPFNIRRLFRGLGIGTLVLAAVYGFLDLDYRPSRAVVLMGAVWAYASLLGLRMALYFAKYRSLNIGDALRRRLIIAGGPDEAARCMELLRMAEAPVTLAGIARPPGAPQPPAYAQPETVLCELDQLDDAVRLFAAEEVIFCSKDCPARDIMTWMTRLSPSVACKILPEDSQSIIGSGDKNAPGELYTIEVRFAIADPAKRRAKRLFDVLLALCIWLGAPLGLPLSARFRRVLWPASGAVFFGKKTWVGYAPDGGDPDALPPLPQGVLTPLDAHPEIKATPTVTARLNFLYARDWSVQRDIEAVLGGSFFRR